MKFSITDKKEIYKGKFTTLWGTDFLVNDKIRTWEWLEKFNISYVLPITKEGKIVLVKQFRIPINTYIMETPAGIIDGTQNPEEVARHELIEETGYIPEKLDALPVCPISSALTNGLAYGFIARGLFKKKSLQLEDAEDIEVIELSKKEILDVLKDGNMDTYVDPKILGAITIAEDIYNINFAE